MKRLPLAGMLLACISLQTILPGAAFAAPLESVKQFVENVHMPRWKSAVQQMQAMRAKPDPEFKDVWQNFDAATDDAKGQAVLSYLSAPRHPKELLGYATWLRMKILADKADGRYSFAYAHLLSEMQNKDGHDFTYEAAVFAYHAKLAVVLDGLSCADPSVTDNAMETLMRQPHLRGMMERVATLPQKKVLNAMLEALALEEIRGERPVYSWFCNQGNWALMRGTSRNESDDTPSVLKGAASQTKPETKAESAELVPLDKWRQMRRDHLSKMLRALAKDL